MLDHPLRVGNGSMFSIRVPVGVAAHQLVSPEIAPSSDALAGLRVLCVDNDPEILDGMRIARPLESGGAHRVHRG